MKNNKIVEIHNKIKSIDDEDIETMSEDQLDELLDLLGDSLIDEDRVLRELPSNDKSVLIQPPEEYIKSIKESKEKYDGIPQEVTIHIDPITGIKDIIMGEEKESEISMMELAKGKAISDKEAYDLIDKNLKEYGEDYTAQDVQEVFAFISGMDNGIIEHGSEYENLPEIFKKEIYLMEKQNNIMIDTKSKNSLARDFYETLKQSLYMDQEFIDLEKAIQKELDFDILDQYLDNIVDIMENDLLKIADDLEEKGDPAFETFREMSAAFTRAYTYETLFKKINNKSGVINRDMTRGLKKFDDRCKRFNRSYKHTKFLIPDIRILAPILDRILPDDIHMDDIKKFILLIISEFLRMDPDNLIHHTEMYYTIKIIESLDYVEKEDSKMKSIVISNICSVIEAINNN